MLQLGTLILALIWGYSFKRLPLCAKSLNQSLFLTVVLILFVMGYEFGTTATDLFSQLALIAKKVITFSCLILIFNLTATYLWLKKENYQLRCLDKSSKTANYLQFAVESGKYIIIITLGVFIGDLIHKPVPHLNQVISVVLFFLLFIIGQQMRRGGVVLKTILLNKTGFRLAIIILFSSLAAGVCAALILGLPLNSGLMLASGFGWYTLSSILNGQLLGPDFATTSFFIDFGRELIAIILLPSLGRYFPLSLIGYCGATAMDFSLPIIKKNLDQECVVIALASGMILSLVVPLLISLFFKL